jgi:nucleoside phosphorylase
MKKDLPPIDILLYIALNEEFNDLSDQLIEKLGDGFMPYELKDIAITIFCGKVFSPALEKDFQLAVVPAGKMGNIRAASITSSILSKLNMRDVVVLGIAGSLSNDLQPGDVFIPDGVNEYLANSATKGKKKTWKFDTSGNYFPTSLRLLNRFQEFQRPQPQNEFYKRWKKDCADRFTPLIEGNILESMSKAGLNIRPEIKLFAGDDKKLASGPSVGKGKAFTEWVKREVDRKFAAMEMESAGVYDAAFIRTPAPRVIAIRGISDFADERKKLIEDAAKNQFRSVSAKNALSLLLYGIEAGLFEADGAGSESDGSFKSESRIRSVFVIGGSTTEDIEAKKAEEPSLNIACFKLGKAIASTQTHLIICSPLPDSADHYTAKGYAEVEGNCVIHFHSPDHPDIEAKRKSLCKTLKHPGLRVEVWKYPGYENKASRDQAWLLAQLKALDKADAVIAIGGMLSKTANTLLHLAEERNLPIIPFSFLGGAAERCFNRIKWSDLHPGFDTTILEHERGVEKVIEIANRLVTDLLAHSYSSLEPQTFFISRAKPDSEIAKALVQWLKSRGYEVLLGDEVIRGDQMAKASIDQAILKSDICVVLWSKHFALSPFCYDELMLAFDRKMDIWFFNLDDSVVVPQKARKLKSISARSTSEVVKIAAELLSKYER